MRDRAGDLHPPCNGGRDVTSAEVASFGRALGASRASASEVSRIASGGPAARGSPPCPRWDPLRAADRLPVEGGSIGVRIAQYAPSVFPGVDEEGRVLPTLEGGVARVRRAGGHRLGLAEPRRSDDEGTARRGKKWGQIRRTEASAAPSVPFLRMETAFLWRWPSPEPTRMTRRSSKPRSAVSPYAGRDPSRAAGSSTSAQTKGTTTPTPASCCVAGPTRRTSGHAAKRLETFDRTLAVAPGAGWWSEAIRGSIAFVASSFDGRRRRTTTKRCFTWPAPSSRGTQQGYWDRLLALVRNTSLG